MNLDPKEVVESYLSGNDWRVKENANVNYSVGGLILSNSGAITANYWLDEVYTPSIAKAHKLGAMHIHDLSMLSGYCSGWSLRQLIQEGLGGVPGKITSKPAKHLQTLMNQMVNFLGIMQNEWAGAQAFASFDTYLAPFVKVGKLSYDQVKHAVESFIYGVNTPSRWGTQAPFSNITLDWICPADLYDTAAIVGGHDQDFTYGQCQEEMDLINKAFLELMVEGDADGRGFQYPIPTYNITPDFNWESKNAELLFEMTAKYGTPYFQNFINSDLDPNDVRSMCCRLRLDKRELRKRGGGLFGSDEFTGSIGVVTINMPQVAFKTETYDEFVAELVKVLDLASDSLVIKRRKVEHLMESGLFPYTKRYLRHFNNHFSTIGIVGMHECCLNFLGPDKGIDTEEGKAFSEGIMDLIMLKLADYQEKTGDLYNLEATPAESTSYRLAKHDKVNHPEIITSGEDAPYYTNSTQLPVGSTADIFEALDHQDKLQVKYTGGTVFHGFLGEAIETWQSCRSLVKAMAEGYQLPYFTLSPTFSVCSTHGYLKGEQRKCPTCGGHTEVYSRIVGYYRDVNQWNAGKAEEFKERKEYDQ